MLFSGLSRDGLEPELLEEGVSSALCIGHAGGGDDDGVLLVGVEEGPANDGVDHG
jgi:hypothetical protein